MTETQTHTAEAGDETTLREAVEVPAAGTEDRDFWLEAAVQHGFEETAGGEHLAEYDPPAYFATEDEVLALMASCRAQGRKDALAASPAPRAPEVPEELRRLSEALKPFAAAWEACESIAEQGGGYVRDEDEAWVSGGARGSSYPMFTFGDLRRAARTLAAAPAAPPADGPRHRIIEAADLLRPGWALTIQWHDGSETVEHVSDNAARVLGYQPEESDGEEPAPPADGGTEGQGVQARAMIVAAGGGSGIYIASKTSHAARWRAMRASGTPIISTWIDEAGKGETACFADLWSRCVDEAATAGALVIYMEPGEVLKGAFVEAGAALSCGVPVYAVGCDEFSFTNHIGVTRCASLEDAFAAAISSRTPAGAAGDLVGEAQTNWFQRTVDAEEALREAIAFLELDPEWSTPGTDLFSWAKGVAEPILGPSPTTPAPAASPGGIPASAGEEGVPTGFARLVTNLIHEAFDGVDQVPPHVEAAIERMELALVGLVNADREASATMEAGAMRLVAEALEHWSATFPKSHAIQCWLKQAIGALNFARKREAALARPAAPAEDVPAERDRITEALAPFASLCGSSNLLDPDDDSQDPPCQDQDEWFRHDGFVLRVGDFRRAKRVRDAILASRPTEPGCARGWPEPQPISTAPRDGTWFLSEHVGKVILASRDEGTAYPWDIARIPISPNTAVRDDELKVWWPLPAADTEGAR